MAQLPNPFLNSGAHVPVALGSAAVNASPPSTAAAVATSVSPGVALPSLPLGESDPSVTLDCAPGESTNHIHEIFHWVRKLMTGKTPAFVLDEGAFMAEVEEVPLFIRDGEHLKRWEA